MFMHPAPIWHTGAAVTPKTPIARTAFTTALSLTIALGLAAGMALQADEALALSPAGSGQAIIAQVNKTAIVPTTGSGAQSTSTLAHTPAVITTQLGDGKLLSVQTLGNSGQAVTQEDALTGAINTTGRNTPQLYTPSVNGSYGKPTVFNNTPQPYTPPKVFNNTPQPYTPNVVGRTISQPVTTTP